MFFNYIQNKEVVYQVYDELMKVSNSENLENRQFLLDNLICAQFVEVYYNCEKLKEGNFSDLTGWGTNKNIFSLVESSGGLMCIPLKLVVENEILGN